METAAEAKYRAMRYTELQDAMIDRGLRLRRASPRAKIIKALLRNDLENTIRFKPTITDEIAFREELYAAAGRHNASAWILFFKLPAEMRNMIYELVLQDHGRFENGRNHHLVPPGQRKSWRVVRQWDPPLLRTCFQLRKEPLSMYTASQDYDYYPINPFREPPCLELGRWLTRLGNRAQLARSIDIIVPVRVRDSDWPERGEFRFADGNAVITGEKCRFEITATVSAKLILREMGKGGKYRKSMEDAVRDLTATLKLKLPWIQGWEEATHDCFQRYDEAIDADRSDEDKSDENHGDDDGSGKNGNVGDASDEAGTDEE